VVVDEQYVEEQTWHYMDKAAEALNEARLRIDPAERDRELRSAEAWIDMAALAKGVALPQRAVRSAGDVQALLEP
jgi:hypothetical protein